jgi:hypothetical protein
MRFLLLAFLVLSSSCSLTPVRIYVSADGNDLGDGSKTNPVRTLETAQIKVREARAEHPGKSVRVILGEGTWHIGNPLVFNSTDGGSGKVGVTWEGLPEGKTILSGGTEITGFKDAGYGIWWAPVDTTWVIEQLYVDGTRATRARLPNENDSLPRFYLTKSTWMYNQDSTVKGISVGLQDRETLQCLMPVGDFEVLVFKDWTVSRFHVSSLSYDPPGLVLKPPFALFDGPYNSIFAGNASRYSCILEGDPSFIDQPGEWALDRLASRIFYKPLPGQSPDKTIVTAPLSQQMIVMKGTRENPIINLSFKNIAFEHAAYILPPYNHDGMQAGYYYPGNSEETGRPGLIPPAIHLTWAEKCMISGGSVRLSGGNGIYLDEGCQDNRIENVTMEDLGANGIMVGLTIDPKADSAALPKHNTVIGCTVTRSGAAFHGSVGIWLGFCAYTEVSGCTVFDVPYTGISVGWQWNPLPTSSHDNLILNNTIHHAMQVLGDGGGIYTLGFQPGSLIKGNVIHDILRSELNHASDNNGMFIDEGSKGYRIEGNTISNTAHTNIRGHRAAGVEVIGNTFHSGEGYAISHTPPYEAMIFANRDSTIKWKNPGWPKELGYGDSVTAFTMKNNKFLKNPVE